MNHRCEQGMRRSIDDSNLSAGAREFVKALLGDNLQEGNLQADESREQLDLLKWVATFSPEHEKQLRRLELAEAEAQKSAELLAWVRSISDLQEATWDPAKHPRRGGPPNAGWFASAGGTSSGGTVRTAGLRNAKGVQPPSLRSVAYPSPKRIGKAKPPSSVPKPTNAGRSNTQATETTPKSTKQKIDAGTNPGDPSRWYLPADSKGSWSGEKGNSVFRLHSPVQGAAGLVGEIEYRNGVPVLDKFALPGKTATIILTGNSDVDIENAKKEWLRINKGKPLPRNATFHHDLLHAVELTTVIDGKKTKVLVGTMPLIPSSINRVVFHQGSASVARKFYQGMQTSAESIAALAKDRLKGGNLVAEGITTIVPGTIAKRLLPFVGRSIVRAIPIIGTGLAVLEFSDNVEAHGVGGAVARTIPVLGDVISASDLGSELAENISKETNKKLRDAYNKANIPVDRSWELASQETIKTFDELASQIQVTNQPGSHGLVDAGEVADSLNEYRQAMQIAYNLHGNNTAGTQFKAAAAVARQALKDRLTKACQKDKNPQRGTIL